MGTRRLQVRSNGDKIRREQQYVSDSQAKKLNMDCLDYKLGDDSVMSLIADELNTKS